MKDATFLGGFIVPHPPILVHEVGGGRENEASASCEAMEALSEALTELAPDTVVLVSPHAPLYRDHFFFHSPRSGRSRLEGSLAQFGSPRSHSYQWDDALQAKMIDALVSAGFSAGPLEESSMHSQQVAPGLDHGAMVPLCLLSGPQPSFQLVCLSPSAMEPAQQFEAGKVLRQVFDTCGRRVLLVASGDLSHKVNAESPYGSCPEGARFDQLLVSHVAKWNPEAILAIPETLREAAAECGYGSVVMLCGAMDGQTPTTRLYSYEAPFGIGYAVASVLLPGPEETRTGPSHVRLAREAIQAFVKGGTVLSPDDTQTAAPLRTTRAGVFVSLHRHGSLRGCIGTIAPTAPDIAGEIIRNALAAATEDPRFTPVRPSELSDLEIHVDVLNPPEPVTSRESLDPKRYGVICESGHRRGLLLPDLDGVDTVADQLNIACQKAGIDPRSSYRMFRFTVTRYEDDAST